MVREKQSRGLTFFMTATAEIRLLMRQTSFLLKIIDLPQRGSVCMVGQGSPPRYWILSHTLCKCCDFPQPPFLLPSQLLSTRRNTHFHTFFFSPLEGTILYSSDQKKFFKVQWERCSQLCAAAGFQRSFSWDNLLTNSGWILLKKYYLSFQMPKTKQKIP